jgi:NitT/TauT family transport system substrate-binding protein
MDSLAPSLQIPSVAILPTSTSDGADQCIVNAEVADLEALKGVKAHGLENSVSQYLFNRYIEEQGMKPEDFQFSMMDPAAAATAFLQGKLDAIVVWNPFCLEILTQDDNAKTLFSSESIPNEIVDMVTMSKASLEKEGGEAFAHAVIDTYYTFCELMTTDGTRDAALTALGQRFSKLGLEDMKVIVKQTRFYDTPAKGIELFEGSDMPETMSKVTDFCVKQGIVAEAPKLSFGADSGEANLVFSSQFIKNVRARK